MTSNAPVPLVRAVRQRWLPVLALAALGAAVAVGVTALRDATYTATATIALDNSALARTPGLPGGERILTELRTDGYYETVGAATGLDATEIRAGLDSFAEGQPMERIRITFVARSEARAEAVAQAAGEAAMDVIGRLNAVERGRQEANAASAAQAVAAMEAAGPMDTAWEKADAAYKLYTVRTAETLAEYTIQVIDNAHRLEDGVTVVRTSLLRSAVTNGTGGAVIGLLVGVGLVYAGERRGQAA